MKLKVLILSVFASLVAGMVFANGFDACPPQAVANLKITNPRKPVRSGYVFVNGCYIPPPYRVSRYGTVIKINGVQVTGQVIPWSRFVNAPQSDAPSPVRERKMSVPSVKKSPVKKIATVDDLFADDPPAQQQPGKSNQSEIDELFGGGAPSSAASAKTSAESVSDDAPFVKSPRTDQMVKRINAYRSDIHRRLLEGDAWFFGTAYSQIQVPRSLAGKFLDALPGAMSESSDANALYAKLRSLGFAFVSRQICADLFANIANAPKIVERRRVERATEDTQNLINSAK